MPGLLLSCLQNGRNVLVASCSEAAIGVRCKLGDFGLSRSVKQHQTHRTTNTVRAEGCCMTAAEVAAWPCSVGASCQDLGSGGGCLQGAILWFGCGMVRRLYLSSHGCTASLSLMRRCALGDGLSIFINPMCARVFATVCCAL